MPAGVSRGSVPETTVSITDDDVPAVEVSFGSATYNATEGGTETVTVTLSADPERRVDVSLARTNQGDASDSDYSLSATSLTFNAGETSKNIIFTATQDSEDDDGESVKLTFDSPLPDGVSAGTTHETTVSITDDDVPAVEVSIGSATYPVDEGETETVTVTLSAAPEREVVVPIDTTDEGGASSDDYLLSATSVTFGPTETSKSFTFTATQDSVDDDGESVKLTFDSPLPAGVSRGSVPETTVSITDDDEADLVLSKASLGPSEGGSESYTVALATQPSAQVTVTITGHADTDLTPDPTILRFTTTDWATAKTVTVEAGHDDDTVNDSATLTHTAAGGGYASVAADLPVTVHDDDADTDPLMETDPDPLVPCIDNNRANIVTVLSEHGMISSPGEVDTWVIPGVDPFRTYFVEILGADSSLDVWGQDVGGSLTLADPHPVSLYHEAGNPGGHGFNSAPGDFGTGGNSRFIFVFSTFGDYVLKVKSGESADDQGIGSYHVLVRYDTYCIENDDGNAVFPFEGGPEGYAFDIRADVSTRFTEYERYSSADQRTHYFAGGHLLGDNWGSEPDEDWYGFELKGSTEYEVYLEGSDRFPVEHRLMRPRITGIYDKDGVLFQEGEAGSGTDPSVTLTFRTAGSGKYYLGVGSNPGGRTGVYNYRVSQTEPDTAGHAASNNSPTGGPGITGLPSIGEKLTATTSGIADADGLENASFSYQWVRHDLLANTDTDIPGATGSTYTVTRQDQDRAIKVRVEFTDDGDNDEELTSFAFLISPPVNTRAAGQPTITGTLEVGQTLTADTSRISDADRKDNATFGYRWIAGDSDIQNATGMSHTLTEDEEGLAIRVSVTFTDDAGNETTLTSSPTEPVEPAAKGSSDPDATRAGAVDLGDITSLAKARYPTYSVNGVDDVVDYFTFTITEPKRVQIGIRQLDADANLTLEHEDGTVIEHKSKPGEEHVAMYPTLLEGAYYVRVDAAEEGHNEYRMAHGVSEPNPDRVAELREIVKPLNRATGSPAIVGTAQVGEPLTADTSGIADADGLENVTFSFQWVVSDGGADVDIAGATDSTYTMVSGDEGKAIKVRVTFTDDADNEESLTSAAVAASVSRSDRLPAAPGTPTVSPEDTGALTVSWKMAPDDGGPPITGYLVQWKEAADRWETAADVSEATVTGTTHTITGLTDGVEYAIRVVANSEAGDSPASEEAFGTPRETIPPELFAAIADGTTLTLTYNEALDENSVPGADTFTVMSGSDERGIARVSVVGAAVILILDSAVVAEDAVTVSYAAPTDESALRIRDAAGNHAASFKRHAVTNNTPGEEPPQPPGNLTGIANEDGSVTLTWDDPDDETITGYQILRQRPTEGEDTLLVYLEDTGSGVTTYTDANMSAEIRHVYRVKAISMAGLSEWSNSVNVTPLEPQESTENTPATGQPTISGTAQVRETLTADTTSIADEDGLENVSFSYQWLADDVDISGATGSTYTLIDSDEGKTVKVEVSFTDNGDNVETLTSTATDVVAEAARPNTPATGQPTITGTAQVGETLTADTTGIADEDGLDSAVFAYQWLSDDAEIGGDTGLTYTLVDDDEGRTIKVRVTVTDDLGNATTLTSAATEAVAAAPPTDSPATGEPTITGTAQVGQTLTVDTSGITDADGLDSAVFAYQWLSDDAEIGGATGLTYTPVADDEGRTIKVRVTVTDDLGNETTLTSAATEAVEAKRNTAATGRPTISGTVRVGETLTADTTGIADADGLTNVSYRYQWVVTDGGAYIDISGEKGATYTLVSADRGLRILVRVSFTDDAGKRERLTSAATDVVAAAA